MKHNPKNPLIPTRFKSGMMWAACITFTLGGGHSVAADGTWNTNSSSTWSTAGNWTPGAVPGGAGTTVGLTYGLSGGAKTVTIDTTSRIVGILNIGDDDTTYWGYTLAASGGASLILDNGLLSAQINKTGGTGAAADTISAPLLLNSSLDLSVNAVAGLTISGGITANTSGTKTLTNKGTGAYAVTLSGIIGDGSSQIAVTQNSATSMLILSGANSYTGGTTVSAGTLQLGNGGTSGSLSLSSAIVNNGTLVFNRSDILTQGTDFNSVISGTGAVTQAGTGTTILNGTNSFTGATTLSAGILSVSASANLGNANSLVFNGGTLQVTGTTMTGFGTHTPTFTSTLTVGLDINDAANTFTVSQVLNQGTGGLTKSGAGSLYLTNANTYTGLTTVSAGTLAYGVSNALSSGGVTANGGTLDIKTFSDTVGAVTLTSGSITGSSGVLTGTSYALNGTGDISAILGGSAALTKTNAGTATLTGVNTFTGVTTLTGGTLSIATIGNGGVAGNLGAAAIAAANLVFNGGTLQYTGTTAVTDRSFTINAATSGTFDITTNNLTISGAGGTATAGALTKTGAGTLTLAGLNTFTGLTTVAEGTLAYGVTNALSSGAVTVNGGVLDISSFSDSVGAVTLTSGSITGTTGVLSGTSYALNGTGTVSAILGGTSVVLTKTNAGTATLSKANTYGGVTSVTGGTLAYGIDNALNSGGVTVNGGILDISSFNDGVGAVTLTSGSITGTTGILSGSSYALNGTGDISAILGGTAALTKTNAGTATLTGVNTFTGVTILTGGVLSVATIGNGGVAGNLGAAPVAAANLVFNGGTLEYTGAAASTNRSFTINANKVAILDVTSAASNLTISGAGGAATNGALTKMGAGTLTLAGTNTYTGLTTVYEGTLAYGVTDALSSGGVTVNGGTLDISSFSDTVGAVTLTAGSITGTTGTLTGTSYAFDGSGTVSAILGGGSVALTKSNAGTVTLTKANIYGGLTSVNGGTLAYGIDNALNGGGVTVNGGILDISSCNDTVGAVTLTSGSITGTTGVLTGTSYAFDGSGTVSAILGGGSVALTKTNAGTVTLTKANTYGGLTSVNGGTLAYGIDNALNSGGVTVSGGILDISSFSDAVGAVTLTSGSITGTTGILSGSSYTLNGTGSVSAILGGTGALTKTNAGTATLTGVNTFTGVTTLTSGVLSVATIGNGGVAGNLGQAAVAASNLVFSGGTLQYTGASAFTNRGFTLTAATTSTIEVTGAASNLTISGAGGMATTGALTKIGVGTLTISGANYYTGTTTVTAGVLNVQNAIALGDTTGPTTVTSGAALQLQGNLTVGAEALTLSGTGISADGALRNISGTNIYGGLVTLGAATCINSDADTLTISNTGTITGATFGLTVGGAGNTTINSIIGTTTGTLIKDGTGTLTLAGANTYTGLTTVAEGTLAYGVANALSSGGVTVNGGTLDISSFSDTVGAVTLMSGSITGTTGVLTGTGYTLNGTGTLSAILGGSATLTKSGTGTVTTLSGSNTYSGATSISSGTLKLGAEGSATNSPLGTTAAGTTVSTDATLDLNGFTLGTAEALTLNGIGVNGEGALSNRSGTAATYSGLLTLGSASRIGATIGDIILSNTGTITGNYDIRLDGSATGSSLASVIGTNASALYKYGPGTWTLSGASSYTGSTFIYEGTLKLGATGSGTNSPLGTTAGVTGTQIGAALDLNGFSLGTAESLTLRGAGVESGGALTNSSTTAATYKGQITLGADASIVASKGDIILSYTAGNVLNTVYKLTLGGEATGSSIASVISSTTSALTKEGTGKWTLTGANMYTGVTTFSAGTLSVATIGNGSVASGNLGSASSAAANLVFDGGTLQYTGASATSTRAFTINNGKTATIDTANNLSFAGATGTTTTGSLTKIGAGKLTLDGTNTYSGTTTISAGTLALGSAGSFANSTMLTVGAAGSSGTVLDLTLKTGGFHILSGQTLGGIGTVNITGYTLTVDSGAHWAPGNSIGTNAVTGSLALASGSTSDFQLGSSTGAGTRVSPYNSDRTTVTNTLTLGGTLNLLDNAGADSNGSVAPGAYLLFTQSGTAGASFASINNITGYHSKVVTSTSGSVFLDNYALAAAASTQTADIGAFHVGVAKTVSLTLNNTAAANATYTETLGSGAFSSTTTHFSAAGSASGIIGGGSGSGTLLVGVGTGLGAGVQSGSTLLALNSDAVNSSGLGSTPIGNQTVTLNATGYNLASTGFNTTSVGLGIIHAGASFGTQSLSINNTLAAGTYNETLGASFVSASGVSTSGSPITVAAGAAANTGLSVGLPSASAGHHSGTVDVQFDSQAVNSSGLGNTALGSLTTTVTVSGDVFNGAGVWSGAGSAWATSSHWTDANGVHAAPGTFASYDNTDTAAFNGSGATTVNLDGTSPSLRTLDLSGASGYTIARGTGSANLQFKSGAGAASLTAGSGGHLISAPVTLASNLTATVTNSGDTLTLSGGIGGDGILTKAGAGTLTLSGTNSYGGATAVSAGTLMVNGSNTGGGTLTVDGSGTLGGSGSLTGAVSVSGSLSPGVAIGALSSGALTLNAGSVFVYQMDAAAESSAAADFLKVFGDLTLNGTVNLDLSATAAFAPNTTLALVSYNGEWNGGFFTRGSTVLTDGAQFTVGANTWQIHYEDTDGGANFTGNYAGDDHNKGHFINLTNSLTAVPEPGSLLALAALLGSGALFRSRRQSRAAKPNLTTHGKQPSRQQLLQ